MRIPDEVFRRSLALLTKEEFDRVVSDVDRLKALGVQSNFDLLSLLWEKVARRAFRIVFTVPEYPYLLASDVYRDFHGAGVWLHSVLQELYRFLRILGNDNKGFREWLEGLEERVGRRRVFEEYYVSRGFLNRLADMYLMFRAPVFFDEFHLYSGFSLPSFLSLLWIYMVERGVGKIIVSSATPERFVSVGRERKDFLKLVEQLATSMGYTFIRVDAETSSEAKPGFEQVRKKLEVRFVPVVLGGGSARGAAAYGLVQRCVGKLLRESDWLEKFKEKGRSLIVVDRFAAVLEAADVVRELTGEKPLIVTSSKVLFSDTFLQPSLADLRSAKLVVGNMAIAFGVDIKGMDLGVVAAKDFPSVVQKVGRFGRGRGDGTALVYLPIPFQKLMVVAELLEPFKGREISHQDFIKLLEHIYPRRGAEALARTYVWVLKAVLPCWVYTFATIIRLRSEMMEKLVELTNMSIQDLTKSETIVGRFASYLDTIGGFLDVVDLPKKLRLTVSRRVNLPPIGLYNLYSFRGLTTVTVKREAGGTVLEEDLSITTVGRNIPIELRDGEFRVRKNQAYGYMMLWLGIGGEEVKDRVRMLDGYVITLRAFADMVGGLLLYQGSPSGGGRMVCKLSAVDESADVWNAPVLVLYSRGRKSEKLIGMLSAMDSAIPIYITSGNTPVRLIGGVYIL